MKRQLNYPTYLKDPDRNLSVGYNFSSWDDVDTVMEAYGKKVGFTTIKND